MQKNLRIAVLSFLIQGQIFRRCFFAITGSKWHTFLLPPLYFFLAVFTVEPNSKPSFFFISFRQKSFSICDQKVCPYAKFRIYCKHHWTFRSLADQIWEKFEGKNKLNILFHNINSDDPSPLLSTIYSRRTQYSA